jgi:branched-chain amino acid transport system ATP-binding protein
VISVRGLSVSYGPVRAVHDVSVDVERGTVVAVVGSNGAGKSSTLRAVSGLVTPAGGEVTVDGTRVTRRPAYKIARLGVRLVPEGGGVFSRMTVRDNLLTGLARGHDRGAALDRVYVRFPILAERHNQSAGSLSGGERQMLALGRALMADPKYVLLDEPSLGLAPLVVARVFEIIGELREEGIGVLLVEQNASQALELADYAYVLEVGALVLEGTGREVRHDPTVVNRYLGGDDDRTVTR